MASGLRPLLLTGLALMAIALLGRASPAYADKVGVAAAVHPDAYSQGTEVKIGNSVFYNQRINTTGSGLVQVLLIDGSTFTVGPGSDLVIDKFVYDPNKNKGEMVATLGKGVLRFVGGKLSKNEGGVTVNTPSGALAIRGGMFHLSVDGHKILASFLFGNHMTITDGGTSKDIFEVGYTYDSGTVRPTRPEDTAFFMKALSGGGQVVVGGTPDNKDTAAPHETAKVDVNEIKQDGTSDVVQGNVQNQPPAGTATPANIRVLTNANFYTAFIGTPNQQNLSNPDVLPGDHGILGGDSGSTADDFTTIASLDLTGERLIAPIDIFSKYADPSNPPTPTGDVFNQHIVGNLNLPASFTTCDNFGVCVVTDGHITGTNSVNGGASEPFDVPLTGSAVLQPGFAAYQLFAGLECSDCYNFEDHGSSSFGQRVDVIQAIRYAISDVTGVDLNSPLLVVTGDKYILPSQGKVLQFQLFTDPRQSLSVQVGSGDNQFSVQNLVAPFATLEGSPLIIGDTSNLKISNLAVLEPDASGGHGVWLQTSFYIGTTGSGCEVVQQSQIVVALGNASDQTGLTGERRGGSQINTFFLPGTPGDYSLSNHITTNDAYGGTSQEHVSYTGGIATVAGANGANFFGTATPNIVIGADSTGAGHNIFLDTPLTTDPTDAYASATYHVGVGSNQPPTTPTQTSGTFNGYAAAIFRAVGGQDSGGILDSSSPSDVTIKFDAVHNTLSATLITQVLNNGEHQGCEQNCDQQGGMTLVLGDPNGSATGRSAFIDDTHYAAIETPGASTIQKGNGANNVLTSAPTGYLVSSEQLQADGPNGVLLFPQVVQNTNHEGTHIEMTHQAFCQDCAFLKWGAWGAHAGFDDSHDQDGNTVIDHMTVDAHLGWWVAGDVVPDTVGTLPLGGTATYSGNVIGTVANDLSGQGAITYVATGNMGMDWNFGTRSGDFSITHFDTSVTPNGLSFGGIMNMPGQIGGSPNGGPNQFTGDLSGSALGGLAGKAAGSFVSSPGAGLQPAGVIGNWNIANSGDHYAATGIFAGKK